MAADEVPKPTDAQRASMEKLARKFMGDFKVPGLSIAFAHRERPSFSTSYGFADAESREELTADHRFRIASVSKPLTSIALFQLMEDGKLALDDKVLGPQGRLGMEIPELKLTPRLRSLTVHHLLTHTGGGWGNQRNDPMFRNPKLDHAALIESTLRDDPLQHDPGEQYAYSNFGYCLLGRIIEKAAGVSYEGCVKDRLLKRCGIDGMEIAGNTRDERRPGEVVYHSRNGDRPYAMNVRRMDAHGGWIARPSELINILVRVDGGKVRADVLKQPSGERMFTASTANPRYACGWAVNQVPNRWHNGSLPGTASIAVITASGMCWAAMTNARTPGIGPALDRLMWDLARCVPDWKA
ncbi:penicillin-binding protein [Haloferula helveola]|uniref:Penicillin-binding protein n=1 Tax=Haloferula helveola TaxID=490095 RepID=A0ABN6H4W5_9BACT|nr:penicillin-binding protein [Haloferula helveola]